MKVALPRYKPSCTVSNAVSRPDTLRKQHVSTMLQRSYFRELFSRTKPNGVNCWSRCETRHATMQEPHKSTNQASDLFLTRQMTGIRSTIPSYTPIRRFHIWYLLLDVSLSPAGYRAASTPYIAAHALSHTRFAAPHIREICHFERIGPCKAQRPQNKATTEFPEDESAMDPPITKRTP